MDLQCEVRGILVGFNERKSEKDGKSYYSLAFMQNGQALNLNCTEIAYQDALNMQFQNVIMNSAFNDKYNSFRVSQVRTDTSKFNPYENNYADSHDSNIEEKGFSNNPDGIPEEKSSKKTK